MSENQFVVGGPVPIGHPSFIVRDHDDECFRLLTARRWVVLLGPRQQGKTTSLIRLRERLIETGLACAVIDMQAYAAVADDYSALLRWISRRLCGAFGCVLVEPPVDQTSDLDAWLSVNVGAGLGSVAVLIDEIAAVPAPHRVKLFSQLRAIYNAREFDNESVGNRIVFLFAGTFRPERLIATENSPFNVSVEVHPPDLTVEQVARLAAGATEDLASWAPRVFERVSGQPYLTQRYFDGLLAGVVEDNREAAFLAIDGVLMTGKDRYLRNLYAPVLASELLSTLVRDLILHDSGVPLAPANEDHLYLQAIGVARASGSQLIIHNTLYRDAAKMMPQLGLEASDTLQLPGPTVLVRRGAEYFDCVADPILRKFCVDGYAAGVNSYAAGDYRLALVAFGGVLESLLLDLLEQLEQGSRDAAMSRVDKPPAGKVERWSFESMVDVAHEVPTLAAARPQLAHLVRAWRNLVHAAVARRDWQSQEALEPEVRTSVAAIDKVVLLLG